MAIANQPSCANCDAPRGDAFCSRCGQSARTPRRGLGAIAYEFLDTYLLTFDSKLTRTLVSLVLRPGVLTRDYLAGKRASQLPPLRTYLVLALLAFLFAPPFALPPAEGNNWTLGERAVGEHVEGRASYRIGLPNPEKAPFAWFPERTATAREKLESINDPRLLLDVLKARFRSLLPNAVLAIVPLVALVLALLHIGSRRPLFDHLMFSLHFQSAAMVLILAATAIDTGLWFAPIPNLVPYALSLLAPIVFVSLHRVYAARWWATLARGVVLLVVYGWIGSVVDDLSWAWTFLTL